MMPSPAVAVIVVWSCRMYTQPVGTAGANVGELDLNPQQTLEIHRLMITRAEWKAQSKSQISVNEY